MIPTEPFAPQPAPLLSAGLFIGRLVRLSQNEPDMLAKAWNRWGRDTLFNRLLDDEPKRLYSVKALHSYIDEDLEVKPTAYDFTVHTMADDRLIGFVDLRGVNFTDGECWLGMGIGERSDWDRGYGTEALRLALRYAFDELNLHRVTLGVFDYNPRARRAYEKAGFRFEGRERGANLRDGERHDVCMMGILRHEWKDNFDGSKP